MAAAKPALRAMSPRRALGPRRYPPPSLRRLEHTSRGSLALVVIDSRAARAAPGRGFYARVQAGRRPLTWIVDNHWGKAEPPRFLLNDRDRPVRRSPVGNDELERPLVVLRSYVPKERQDSPGLVSHWDDERYGCEHLCLEIEA